MVKKRSTDDEDENKNQNDQDDQDDEGGSGGSDSGGAAGGTGTWVPNYYELMGLSTDEKQLAELASQALFEQRISLKSQGHEVTALSKMQKLRNKLDNPGIENSAGASASLAEHPELADMGGDVDPNNIVLPESEAAERSNDPNLALKLKQRMAAKMGMSQDISLQSMKEEYKKKMEARAKPQPDEPQPRYRPVEAPKFKPPGR